MTVKTLVLPAQTRARTRDSRPRPMSSRPRPRAEVCRFPCPARTTCSPPPRPFCPCAVTVPSIPATCRVFSAHSMPRSTTGTRSAARSGSAAAAPERPCRRIPSRLLRLRAIRRPLQVPSLRLQAGRILRVTRSARLLRRLPHPAHSVFPLSRQNRARALPFPVMGAPISDAPLLSLGQRFPRLTQVPSERVWRSHQVGRPGRRTILQLLSKTMGLSRSI